MASSELLIPGRDSIGVGVDGSPASRAALRWAGAHRRVDQQLHAVIAREPGDPFEAFGLTDPERDEAARVTVCKALREALGEGWEHYAHAEVAPGSPKEVLTKLSTQVEQLVIGTSAHSSVVADLLASVSHHLVVHASCPVTVVQSEPTRAQHPAPGGLVIEPGSIIVGVHDSPSSAAALAWATKHRRHGQQVYAIHVWDYPLGVAAYPGYIGIDPDQATYAGALLESVLSKELGHDWSSTVVGAAVRGAPKVVLPSLAKDADQLVIGGGRHIPVVSAALGETSEYVVTHTDCAVTVVGCR